VSSLRRGHANLLCIVPILTDDPRRESETNGVGDRPVRLQCAASFSLPVLLPVLVQIRSNESALLVGPHHKHNPKQLNHVSGYHLLDWVDFGLASLGLGCARRARRADLDLILVGVRLDFGRVCACANWRKGEKDAEAFMPGIRTPQVPAEASL